MNKTIQILFIVFLINLLFNTRSFSQNAKIDSLLSIIKISKNDSNKVNTLYSLCGEYNSNKVRRYDKSIILANEILALSEKINFKSGIYYYHDVIGFSYYRNNENEKAIKLLGKSIIYFKLQNYKLSAARSYGSIGNCYYRLNLFPKALENFIEALKIYEELNKKLEIAGYSGNIGAIYNSINNNEKALEFYYKALKINEEIKNEQSIAINLVCIGNSYNDLKKYTLAEEYYKKALSINEKLENREYYANNILSIGNVKSNLDQHNDALKYFKMALEIFEELKEPDGTASALHNMGVEYRVLDEYDEAIKCVKRSLQISKDEKFLSSQKSSYNELSNIYYKTGDFKLSIDNYKIFISLKDSLDSEFNQKSILQKQMEYDFEKKEAFTKAEFVKEQSEKQLELEKRKQAMVLLEKDNKLRTLDLNQSNLKLKTKEAETESQKKQVELLNKDKLLQTVESQKKAKELEQQKQLRNVFILGAILLLCFAVYILLNLSKSKKINKIIERQKQEVEHQKHIVDYKQKEIVDSINYAQRIQYALLANKKLLDENLPDYFLLFQPKDVVSGDFYWATNLNNNTFALVTADSTGHGVPGAIMSILNIASLNEAVKGDKLVDPSDILNETRIKIINHLYHDGSAEGGKDGMDCSLICFNFKEKKLTYSAANNPVWIIRENKLISFKADKMPIGKHDKDHIPFTQTEVQLQKGDVVYTFTDGYADQFGGVKGKKFKYKQLEELLLSIHSQSMPNQQAILLKTFHDWKGSLEQVDDVCIIGVRV